MMALYFRKRIPFGPLRINLSRSGVSTSIKVGNATVNPQRRRVWVNLPGPFFWTTSLRKKRQR